MRAVGKDLVREVLAELSSQVPGLSDQVCVVRGDRTRWLCC
jgi:hypothetical protein